VEEAREGAGHSRVRPEYFVASTTAVWQVLLRICIYICVCLFFLSVSVSVTVSEYVFDCRSESVSMSESGSFCMWRECLSMCLCL